MIDENVKFMIINDRIQSNQYFSIILDISSSISFSNSFIFLILRSLSNLGSTICVLACGLPVLLRIYVLMFFYSWLQKQPLSSISKSKSLHQKCSTTFVDLWLLFQYFTGFTASPFYDFLAKGALDCYCFNILELSTLLIYLESGVFPIGSILFVIFLWVSGLSCCLLDMIFRLCLQIINITELFSHFSTIN